MKQTDIIKNIENWFRTAVPSPGIFDQNVQASCIIEETMEFVSHLGYDNDKTPLYSLKNQFKKWGNPNINNRCGGNQWHCNPYLTHAVGQK